MWNFETKLIFYWWSWYGIVSAPWLCTLNKTHHYMPMWLANRPSACRINSCSHCKETSSATVQGLSFLCTPRPRRKKTTRWPIAGREIPTESSFLWVFAMWASTFLCITNNIEHYRPRPADWSDRSARTGAAQQTGGVTTPLLDVIVTVRLLGEFAYKGKRRRWHGSIHTDVYLWRDEGEEAAEKSFGAFYVT